MTVGNKPNSAHFSQTMIPLIYCGIWDYIFYAICKNYCLQGSCLSQCKIKCKTGGTEHLNRKCKMLKGSVLCKEFFLQQFPRLPPNRNRFQGKAEEDLSLHGREVSLWFSIWFRWPLKHKTLLSGEIWLVKQGEENFSAIWYYKNN